MANSARNAHSDMLEIVEIESFPVVFCKILFLIILPGKNFMLKYEWMISFY